MSSSNKSKYPAINLAEGFQPLKVKGISQAVIDAENDIAERLSGVQFALKTRLPKLNKALGGGFQTGNIYYIAGSSGAGKSTFRNQIETDFCDPNLNGAYPHKFVVLNFTFEMSAADEVIRSFSTSTGFSYGEIMSAEKPFTQFGQYRGKLLEIANRPVFFVETSGHRMQIAATIHHVHTMYPDHELVIMFDHTLLAEFLDEKDEIELLAKLAKLFIKVRKNYPCMIIMLGQMNDKIEHPIRIQNAGLHYPTKTDIHGSKQLYWACDYVGVLHRPEELSIDKYGKNGYATQGLLAFHLIKARKGIVGLLRLKAGFAKGTITEWT
jgi:replicative DNA helicase